MNMSTSVSGIRDLDGKFSQMIEIKKLCDEANVGYPVELVEYFREHGDAERVEYLRKEMEEVDIFDALVETSGGGSNHYQVDLSKLSSEVKAIRFTNSWSRYTVRMLGAFSSDLDIDGVCHVVRDSLESGIIPVIEIDTPEGK